MSDVQPPVRPSFRASRRSFVKMAGMSGITAGLTRWMPQALAQSAAAPASSIAPLFPHLPTRNLYVDGGIDLAAFLAYDPANDPDARYFRSLVPAAQRIQAFPATQAHPSLSPLPQVADFSNFYSSLDNGDSQGTTRYGVSNDVYVTRFQQYRDIVSYWQVYTSIPNPALTDVAHRNGAKCIAFMFNDTNSNFDASHFLQKNSNGEYIVGNKLVDLAVYFGFDGYMFDMENGYISDLPSTFAMFQAMRKRALRKGLPDLYLQAYAANGDWEQIDEDDVQWLTTPHVANSYFLDYSWDGSLSTTEDSIAKYKLNPYKQVFFGLELEGGRGGPGPISTRSSIDTVIPPNGTGKALGSLALFDPANPTVYTYGIPNAKNSSLPAVRQAVYDADRVFWSGSSMNPASDNTAGYGMANYITERSVIGSFPFLTRFNTGAGNQFFIDGVVSSQLPWFNLGIQDVLPTWQWWTRAFDGNTIPSGLLTASYDQTTAWNGGSSLKVSGQLGPNNPTELRLFKTRLVIPGGSDCHSLDLTFKLGQHSLTNLYVGLVFEDAPTATEWIAIDECRPEFRWGWGGPWGSGDWHAHRRNWNSSWQLGCGPRDSSGWQQAVVNLARYAGRTIAAISLGFKANRHVQQASSYTIHIGEMTLSDGTQDGKPCSAPTGFALERSQIVDRTSAQLRLTWTFDPATWYYDIYRRQTPSSTDGMLWLGRISCDCYYVNSMPRLGNEKFAIVQLVAVARNGAETVSDQATLKFPWSSDAGTAGFTLAPAQSSVSMATGTSAAVAVTVTELNGFNGKVTFSTSGLPAGVTASFSPNPATNSGGTGTKTTLTFSAGTSVVAGTYTVTITGTSGSLSNTATVSLSVGSPNFSLSDSSGGYIALAAGSSSTDTISVTPVYGFNGAVALSASGIPAGVTASFSPASTKTTSVVTFAADATYDGSFVPITITGTSGSITQSMLVYIY